MDTTDLHKTGDICILIVDQHESITSRKEMCFKSLVIEKFQNKILLSNYS